MVVYFDPKVCKYCLMQNERYLLADRHEDIYAACEQLMPEGDVIYGDVKKIQEENRSACAGGGNICN